MDPGREAVVLKPDDMLHLFLVLLAAALLLILLVHERKERQKPRLIVKTILSGLFVLVALLQPVPVPSYGNFILLGLLFCLAGDVCLALPGGNLFRAGLFAFLIGHILYVLGFMYLVPPSAWAHPAALFFWGFSLLVFLWLRPNLKSMQVPVAAYVLVITVMISGAWAVFAAPSISSGGGGLIFAGALLFYVSDIFVARNQFVHRGFLNRLIGLPLYYTGQFLLAFSIGNV